MNEDLYTTGYGIQEGGKGLYLNLFINTDLKETNILI